MVSVPPHPPEEAGEEGEEFPACFVFGCLEIYFFCHLLLSLVQLMLASELGFWFSPRSLCTTNEMSAQHDKPRCCRENEAKCLKFPFCLGVLFGFKEAPVLLLAIV